jgi:uncharacterized membrane protein YkoI
MKLISLAACAFVLCLAPLQADPLHPQGNARITKNEAEHIALKSYPGARVAAAKLETVNGTLVWSLAIVPASGQPAQQVAVDATTGRMAPDAAKKP